jgi:hypothetical protein
VPEIRAFGGAGAQKLVDITGLYQIFETIFQKEPAIPLFTLFITLARCRIAARKRRC